jgi:hypothetical protein
MEILISHDTARISYHPLGYLQLEWNEAYCCGDLYRQSLEELLAVAQQRSIKKILLNQQNKDHYLSSDTLWALQQWYPRLAKALGIGSKLAIILQQHLLPFRIERRYEAAMLQNAVFSSLQEACSWLAEEC